MGYYTSYTLSWIPENIDNNNLVAEAIQMDSEARCALQSDGASNESTKWYKFEGWLSTISRLLPDISFTMYGEGEAAGDVWKCYAKEGKTQKTRALLSFEPPNIPGFNT